MLTKIIGLLLMLPFISAVWAIYNVYESNKNGYEITWKYFVDLFFINLVILLVMSSFVVGIYILFK